MKICTMYKCCIMFTFLALYGIEDALPEKIYFLSTLGLGNEYEYPAFEGAVKQPGQDLYITHACNAALTHENFYAAIAQAMAHKEDFTVFLHKDRTQTEKTLFQLLTQKGLHSLDIVQKERAASYTFSHEKMVFERLIKSWIISQPLENSSPDTSAQQDPTEETNNACACCFNILGSCSECVRTFLEICCSC